MHTSIHPLRSRLGKALAVLAVATTACLLAIASGAGVATAASAPDPGVLNNPVELPTGVPDNTVAQLTGVPDKANGRLTASQCSYSVAGPWWSDNMAKGSGRTSCDHADIYLYRLRWFGWEQLDSKQVSSGMSGEVSWYCRGVGTYTYRVRIVARNWIGWRVGDTASDKRFSC